MVKCTMRLVDQLSSGRTDIVLHRKPLIHKEYEGDNSFLTLGYLTHLLLDNKRQGMYFEHFVDAFTVATQVNLRQRYPVLFGQGMSVKLAPTLRFAFAGAMLEGGIKTLVLPIEPFFLNPNIVDPLTVRWLDRFMHEGFGLNGTNIVMTMNPSEEGIHVLKQLVDNDFTASMAL